MHTNTFQTNSARFVTFVVIQLASCLCSALAHAESDSAAASAYFEKAVDAMNAGNFDLACPLFQKSQSLDPLPGTQFSVATCWDRAGKIATAVANYEVYMNTIESLSPTGRGKYASQTKEATSRMAIIKPKIPELTVVLPANPPTGTRIARDGIDLAGSSIGESFPVDPGEHLIVVDTPGRPRNEQRITLRDGEKKVVTVVILPPTKHQPSQTSVAVPLKLQGPSTGSEAPASKRGRSTGVIVWITLLSAISVGGFVVGGVTGWQALKQADLRDTNCDDLVCNQLGLDAVSKGQGHARWSTVGFIAGGTGLVGAGMVWFLTSPGNATPKNSRVAPMVAANRSGVSITLSGVF